MYNLLYIDGNKHELINYAIIFNERAKAAKACGCNFGTTGHIKSLLDETAEVLGELTPIDDSAWGAAYKEAVDVVGELGHEWMLEFLFMKRVGHRYEEL